MHSIPVHLIHLHGASKATQLRVLAYLRTIAVRAGWWTENDDEIAKFLGIARITLRRSFEWLTEQGYLECVGFWPEKYYKKKVKRYRLVTLKRHPDANIRYSRRLRLSDAQVQSNEEFLLALMSMDISRKLRAARYETSRMKDKEALSCRRRPKNCTPSQVAITNSHFRNRYKIGTRRLNRVKLLAGQQGVFFTLTEKTLIEGLTPLHLAYIDRRTPDGWLYAAKDGKVYERKTTKYSREVIYPTPVETKEPTLQKGGVFFCLKWG